MRQLIKAADQQVIEEWQWSVPAWSHDGSICTGETYKSVVTLLSHFPLDNKPPSSSSGR
jgi:hypothetical protein